jgi:hypothetical protein
MSYSTYGLSRHDHLQAIILSTQASVISICTLHDVVEITQWPAFALQPFRRPAHYQPILWEKNAVVVRKNIPLATEGTIFRM